MLVEIYTQRRQFQFLCLIQDDDFGSNLEWLRNRSTSECEVLHPQRVTMLHHHR